MDKIATKQALNAVAQALNDKIEPISEVWNKAFVDISDIIPSSYSDLSQEISDDLWGSIGRACALIVRGEVFPRNTVMAGMTAGLSISNITGFFGDLDVDSSALYNGCNGFLIYKDSNDSKLYIRYLEV